MIVQDLIKASMRVVGVLSSGESPETAREAEALEALQVMLRSWAQKRIQVFASVKESFNLASSQTSYTWGTGGNIATTRPHQILGAFVKDTGGTDHPIRIISEGEYRNFSSKATLSRPEYLFYHPLYPLAYIYLYPTPNIIETMWLDSLKPFTETSSFATVSDTVSFPPNYLEAIKFNLAIRIAPEYGVRVSAEAIKIATDSYDALVVLNASNQVESLTLSLPVDSRCTFDILRG